MTRPFVRLLHEAAAQLGGQIALDGDYAHVGRYTGPDGRVRTLFGNALGVNGDGAAALATDKTHASHVLRAAGLPVPEGVVVFSSHLRHEMGLRNARVAAAMPGPEAAQALAGRWGYPLIVKPNNGSQGHDVSLVTTPEELSADLARLLPREGRVRVETFVPGADTRVVVLDGQVRLAYERRPLSVTGDGQRPVAALIGAALADLARLHRGAKIAADDPRIDRSLAAQGVCRATIPAPGRVLRLIENANLSTGGRARDVTGHLPPASEALALRAAAALGLRLAGVDILAPDLTTGTEGAVVLEVNGSPGFDYYAGTGPAEWARARAVVMDALRGA